jgi:hypothetical protein
MIYSHVAKLEINVLSTRESERCLALKSIFTRKRFIQMGYVRCLERKILLRGETLLKILNIFCLIFRNNFEFFKKSSEIFSMKILSPPLEGPFFEKKNFLQSFQFNFHKCSTTISKNTL